VTEDLVTVITIDRLRSLDDPQEEDLRESERRTVEFGTRIVDLIRKNKTKSANDKDDSYIFGTEPTALDVITAAFVGRIHDKQRFELLPPELFEWYLRFRESDIWKRGVPTGRTLAPNFL
jgi:hypothetical protein